MEKNVQKRFIKLLNQFDQAKEEENDEKKEKMLNEIRSSWKNLWDQLDKKQNRLRTSIDRQLQIFRNRDHLAAAQERDFEQARQLKKRFLELMEYRKRKDLFSDWEKSWSFLLFVTKQKLRRLISILERNTNTVFAFISKFEAITNRINKIKNEQTYKSHTQKINRMIDMMYQKNYGIVKASIENIQSISVDNLKSLSEYLAEKQKTKDEQKLAEITKKLTTYVQDVKQFADRAKGFPRKVQEKLNEKGFKSMKQFKELLSEIGLEKLKDLIEKNDQLAKEFFKLKRKTNSFLKSLRKKKASEEEEEKN